MRVDELWELIQAIESSEGGQEEQDPEWIGT